MSTGQSLSTRSAPDDRLNVSAPLLVGGGATLVVLALVALDRLDWLTGAIAVAAFAAITLLAVRSMGKDNAQAEHQHTDTVLDPAAEGFADILSQPCLIINDRAVVIYCNAAARARFPRARPGDPLAFTLRDPDLVTAIDAAVAHGQPQQTELHIAAAPNDIWF